MLNTSSSWDPCILERGVEVQVKCAARWQGPLRDCLSPQARHKDKFNPAIGMKQLNWKADFRGGVFGALERTKYNASSGARRLRSLPVPFKMLQVLPLTGAVDFCILYSKIAFLGNLPQTSPPQRASGFFKGRCPCYPLVFNLKTWMTPTSQYFLAANQRCLCTSLAIV
jgi:hypothetical protein